MADFILLMIGAILVNNILLIRFLGNCPFLGVSRSMDTATGMGMAVIFVLTLAGTITWLVHAYILAPLGLEYLRNHCLYPGDCDPGTVCGDGSAKDGPCPV